MNQELLQYSWEDLAGALLVKSKDTTYRDSETIKDYGVDKEGKFTIQNIMDKVNVLEEFIREHRNVSLHDVDVEGIPAWFHVSDLILQLECAINGFAVYNEHCDSEYKFIVAQKTSLMAIECIAEYGIPVYEFAKKHGYRMDTGPNLIKLFLAELEGIKS